MAEVVAEALVALRPHADENEYRRRIQTAVTGAERNIGPVEVQADTRHATAQLRQFAGFAKGLLALEGARRGISMLSSWSDAARDLEEATNAANVQFEEGASIVDSYAETAFRTAGLSRRAALDMSTTFGAFFDQLDVGSDVVARLSVGLTHLSGGLASMRNLSVAEAGQKIAAGLAGESEPLRRVGVFLDENKVKAKAAEMNLGGLHRELTDGEKVLARYQLITEGLSKAQDDFVRTSGGLANQQRALAAESENLGATLGNLVNPALQRYSAMLGTVTKSAEEQGKKGIDLGEIYGQLIDRYTFAGQAMALYRRFVDDGADATDTMADAQDAAREAADRLSRSVKTQTEALQRQAVAALEAWDIDLARRGAALDVANAGDTVARAQRELADAIAGTGEHADRAARATDRLADAHRDLARAQERVKRLTWDLSDAQEELAEAVFRFGPGSREAREAARNLEKTQADLQEANADSADAARDLADAQDEATAAAKRSEAIADATRRLEEARLRLETAVKRAADAEGALAAASDQSKTATEKEADAIRATIDAMKTYASTLDGPVRAAMDARIAQMEAYLTQIREVNAAVGQLAPTPLFGPDVPAIGAGALAPGAIGPGALAPGAVGGGDLGGSGVVGAKSVTINQTFTYSVPPDHLAAMAEAMSGVDY